MIRFYLQTCCFLFLLLMTVTAKSQTQVISPLRRFLQQEADTTIVFKQTTNWIGPSSYYAYFISKKGDQITCYIYRDHTLASSGNSNAKKIQLGKVSGEIILVPEDSNAFFNVYPVKHDDADRFWSALKKLDLWRMIDDKVEGEGCVDNIRVHDGIIEDVMIYDAGGIQLSLITKDQVKELHFYAPGYFEEKCPGRAGRIAILKVEALFHKYIKGVLP